MLGLNLVHGDKKIFGIFPAMSLKYQKPRFKRNLQVQVYNNTLSFDILCVWTSSLKSSFSILSLISVILSVLPDD